MLKGLPFFHTFSEPFLVGAPRDFLRCAKGRAALRDLGFQSEISAEGSREAGKSPKKIPGSLPVFGERNLGTRSEKAGL